MKRILFSLILCWPILAFGQDSINPYKTQLPCNIILHYTDVYYNPFGPPGGLDTRENLCNQSNLYQDPNGIGNGTYSPMVYDTPSHAFVALSSWAPHGTPIGPNVVWQRFFTARDKPNHTHSDITAGGYRHDSVIISKNEDVDFRASGTVKLENGFHAKPGCFFHAYQEPRWGSTVFKDDFDTTALDGSKWHVVNGWGDAASGAECSSDSNIKMDTDYQATDGHALDLILRETLPDTCSCNQYILSYMDTCKGTLDTLLPVQKFIFTSPSIRSCPWPWVARDTPLVYSYANPHGPYGKYEVREKIPHVEYHTNTWGGNAFEWDMCETYWPFMNTVHPQIQGDNFLHGPYKGIFGKRIIGPGDTQVVFRSSQPSWSYLNNPYVLIIDRIPYEVQYQVWGTDSSVFARPKTAWDSSSGFPYSLRNSTDSFIFYYQRTTTNVADTVTWKVTQDSHGTWRVFSAPYHVIPVHDSLRFSKAYQPTSVTLTNPLTLVPKTYTCNWMYWLESPSDSGLIYLEDTMLPSDAHSNTEAYKYTINEGAGGYIMAPVPFNADDTTGGYAYHTFAMEMLPNEVRFLVDSNVVRRIPDRLVPMNSPYYDRASQYPRSIPDIYPSEVDIGDTTDRFGTIPGTQTYVERKYFEHAASVPGWPGMWDVILGGHTYHAAHTLVDYMKVWDVPADVKISNFPK